MTQNLETFALMAVNEMSSARDGLADAFGGSEFGPDDLIGLVCGVGGFLALVMTGLAIRHINEKNAQKKKFGDEAARGENIRKNGILFWYKYWLDINADTVTVVAEEIDQFKLEERKPELGSGKK